MTAAIMQPYLFPYIGYYQLMNAADLFVYYDDVQYIKGGWINRNRYLVDSKVQMFTFPVQKDSLEKNISERFFCDFEKSKQKFFNMMKTAYNKAPFYTDAISVLAEALNYNDLNISSFIIHSNIVVNEYLGITTPYMISSKIAQDKLLRGEKKLISLCKSINADHYINPQGGMELYSRKNFGANNLKLSFLVPKQVVYNQFHNKFEANLSIVDVMMFNSKENTKNLLGEYELV